MIAFALLGLPTKLEGLEVGGYLLVFKLMGHPPC